jgi:TRAP-type mannitol/chloroaromatic compound transport system permease small subunit
MRIFVSAVDALTELVARVVAPAVLVATAVIVFEVVSRYVFNAPTIWAMELTTYLCMACYFLGASYALMRDSHIKIDLLYVKWSPRTRAIADCVMAPIFFGSVGIITWVSAEWTVQAVRAGVTTGSSWDTVVWPVRALIPLGGILLLLQGLAKLVRDIEVIRQTAKGRPRER